MRSLFRTFSLVLICLLLIASSDAAINIYGHRVGPSLAAAQGTSVVTVNPRAYQTPAYANEIAFTSPSNTGHEFDFAEAHSNTNTMQGKSCKWYSFRPVSGQITRITLKLDWSISGELSTNAPNWEDYAEASASFYIFYSTDNGSNLATAIFRGESSHMYNPGEEIKPFGDSGSLSVDLPANTPINQIIVSDDMFVSTDAINAGSASARGGATISNIRLEIETLNCPASVATDRWRGEFYNNINLSGIPTTVRDDGAGFLNFNFGDGNPPAGTCGLTDDNFSARWARMINFPRGLYRFTATADDGVRLYVDGQLKIDAWFPQGATTYTADVFLTAGNHEIKLEYFEYTGGALISLNWTTLINCVASVPADRWKGEYYNTTTLTGDLALVRDDGAGFLNLNFGNGGPGSVCAQVVDNFSARWTRTVNFAAGTYRFFAAVDNGVRLYVDGQLKIDQWGNLPPNTYMADVTLSAAPHEVKLEFVEYTGGASISLFWGDVNCLANVPAGRWKGEYFNNTTLSGNPLSGQPWMVRDDGDGFLNFNFGLGSPGAACSLTDDNFSARWTRMIYFPRGVHRFTATADDGVRLYVDGQLKIDAWFPQGATTYTADVFLTAGNHEIKLEYFEYTGGALISLNWTTLINCVASVPADRWKGEYYNTTTLTGDLALVRDDGAGFLNLNFGNGGPGSVCAQVVDNFSARWTRTVNFAAGTYRFFAAVDNGVRLYVDGQLKIDQWGNLPPNTYMADVTLSAAPHEVKLEFVEYTGGASISLFWGDVNCLANVPAGRWKGEYFNNTTLSGNPLSGQPWMVRDDGDGFLNFNFGLGSPGAACSLTDDNFSARWTRMIYFPRGVHRFTATADDGVRLYVDGQLKIDAWFPQGATTYTADVFLTAGNHEIKLEYFEYTGGALISLNWTTLINCVASVPADRWKG